MNEPIKFTITPGLPPPFDMSEKSKLPFLFPLDPILARFAEIGYHEPASSEKALNNAHAMVMGLRQGRLMISRKAVDAKGNTGIFTFFR